MGRADRNNKLYSRRSFIKWIGLAAMVPVLYLWARLIRRNDMIRTEKELIIPQDELSEGFNIFGQVIIVRSANDMTVFSSSCTHLGCTISQIENDNLVCPCHGSRYDLNGNPVKGPSVKSLKKLRYVINDEKKEIVINLVR